MNRATSNAGQRSLKVIDTGIPFDSLHVVSYWRPIVTLSLKCIVLDIRRDGVLEDWPRPRRHHEDKILWPWP